jgi:hypothetical protein
MRYASYEAAGREPNIIVDGSATSDTRLTLSHWPRSGTPASLKSDLSAGIVFRYLESPALRVDAAVVSNNHFDQDGLVGLYALLEPDDACRRRELLLDVAAAGDFATYRYREAARAAFTLSAFADPELSPLDGALFAPPYVELTTALHRELLPRLPEVMDHPERYRRYWEAEDAWLAASEAGIRSGRITIREIPSVDLAVVSVAPDLGEGPAHRFALPRGFRVGVHPMALHNATRRFRILLAQGHRYQLQFRYETWVQYVSARPMSRVDLTPLARRLTDAERGHAEWSFTGAASTLARLEPVGARESSLPLDALTRESVSFLENAPPAWDPYDPD